MNEPANKTHFTLHEFSSSSDWFIALFTPVVIGQSEGPN